MNRLIRAEFVKLRTTQVWFWLLIAAVAIASAITIGVIASNNIHNAHDVAEMFAASQTAFVAVFVLGVLGVTTEFRYQTITPTVLVTPSRWALITAKMITYLLLGAAYAIICLAVQLAIALPWLAGKGVHYSLGDGQIPRSLFGVFLVVMMFGIIGLGVGALLKNQIVAVSVGLVFLIVLQRLLLAIPGVKYVFPYLPDGGVGAILRLSGDDRSFNNVTLLPAWGGVVVLLLWAFIPAILGAGITMNRDIT